mgnify:CR=1 FL=1
MRIRRGEIETIETRQITSYDKLSLPMLLQAFDMPSIDLR